MLLAIMLLYVGAVLCVNGIWLVGASRGARNGPGDATMPSGSAMILNGREVAVLNIFVGSVGAVIAVVLVAHAGVTADASSASGAGYILLFAFTYLWVACNQYIGADNNALGWYCLFVAITAVIAGIFQFQVSTGSVAQLWLGIDWFAWAVLWFLYWMLLTLKRPIGRLTGWVAILQGIGTAWIFGIALLQNVVSF